MNPRYSPFPIYRYLAVAALLLVLLPVTWGMREWYVSRVETNAAERQKQVVDDALKWIERDFTDRRTALESQAQRLAESRRLVDALKVSRRSGQPSEAVVDLLTRLDVVRERAVEVYDTTGQLLGWQGFGLPAPAQGVHRVFRERVVADENVRRSLVIWWPVVDRGTWLGSVRMAEVLDVRTPVQNQFLRDFSLESEWSRRLQLPVTIRYDGVPPQDEAVAILWGAEGHVFGHASVAPPATEVLVRQIASRFDDVMAFWATLLICWLLAGLWAWYKRAETLPGRQRGTRVLLERLGRFAILGGVWLAVRFVLLTLDVPSRWQAGKAPFSPLFDPVHLASGYGGGLMRSAGDYFITSVFAVVFAVIFVLLAGAFRERAAEVLRVRMRMTAFRSGRTALVAFFGTVILAGLATVGLTLILGSSVQHAILDSTLDYMDRSGLLPAPLVTLVLSTMVALALALFLLSTGIFWIAAWFSARWYPAGWKPGNIVLGLFLALVLPLFLVYLLTPAEAALPVTVAAAFLGLAAGLGINGLLREEIGREVLSFRYVLPTVILLALFVYPAFFAGIDLQRRMLTKDATDSFDEGRDPRIMFSIDQMLRQAQANSNIREALLFDEGQVRRFALDSLAVRLIRSTLPAPIGGYDLSLTFLDAEGKPVGRHSETEQRIGRGTMDLIDAMEFEILREMYEEEDRTGTMVEQMTGRRDRDRFQYAGIVPIAGVRAMTDGGWVMVRAEPQLWLQTGLTPYPRVLLPATLDDRRRASIALAEFRDGILIRSQGNDFGRYRLAEDVRQQLSTRQEIWRSETVKGQLFLTYYRRQEFGQAAGDYTASPVEISVVAARVPELNFFDHLYYLLRLSLGGIAVALPLYLLGVYLRSRQGALGAERIRYRDRVMNAFLVVGVSVVALVAVIGIGLVTSESDQAVQNLLRQHLERVEQSLILAADGSELPFQVLDRISVDSLAARVGLDLNVYEREGLVASSREQLVRERLIPVRMPIEAYQALFIDGYRFTHTREEIGTFGYTAGYRALPDGAGIPRYVISVPTLPEQERIEEERARTVAYLFGAMLLLIVTVIVTAAVTAGALSRPIGRLREGLEAVARGRFERPIPVQDSRDEIGELVVTFNQMQEQLAESRRKLAQQERQLAWREMARQVAHEIKNPLTPMKLSIQHLRRAFDDARRHDQIPGDGKFPNMFERVTRTLIEQIDALVRIANDFSGFARLPTRMLEPLDLNSVVREAVALMQEEADTEIVEDLYDEPLILEADREELRRIYINLIKNALQAIPENRQGFVTVSTRRAPSEDGQAGGWAQSVVTDTGSGIQEELRERIFEPNFSTKTSGTGLGLAIVKRAVEELHGEIGFETTEGEGTAFWMRLPLLKEV
jgi:two-component system, NtrC family, nitrogen regulation sensor histidine kinase NtrY